MNSYIMIVNFAVCASLVTSIWCFPVAVRCDRGVSSSYTQAHTKNITSNNSNIKLTNHNKFRRTQSFVFPVSIDDDEFLNNDKESLENYKDMGEEVVAVFGLLKPTNQDVAHTNTIGPTPSLQSNTQHNRLSERERSIIDSSGPSSNDVARERISMKTNVRQINSYETGISMDDKRKKGSKLSQLNDRGGQGEVNASNQSDAILTSTLEEEDGVIHFEDEFTTVFPSVIVSNNGTDLNLGDRFGIGVSTDCTGGKVKTTSGCQDPA